MNGWVKLHRQILEWEWYMDIPIRLLFLHLVLKANHKEKKYKGTLVEVGCLLTSRDDLAKETGLTVKQIRRALDKLKTTGEIASKTSPQGTHIQLLKYSDYQITASETANERPANGQQTATNKKVRKKRTEEADAAAPISFTEPSEQILQFKNGTLERWNQFTSLWQTTEDPEILNKKVKKKYWDNLSVEVQENLVKMIQNLGSDVAYLKQVWISECFREKTMNTNYLQSRIDYYKKNKGSKEYLGSGNNFTTNY
jgi:DNA-binding transcriptional MerR regulator